MSFALLSAVMELGLMQYDVMQLQSLLRLGMLDFVAELLWWGGIAFSEDQHAQILTCFVRLRVAGV